MDTLLIASGVLNLILLGLVCCCVFYLNRAGKTLGDYEQFYNDSITDIERQMVHVRKIARTNETLYNDEDTRQMFRATQAIYETLIAYVNAGKIKRRQQKLLQ